MRDLNGVGLVVVVASARYPESLAAFTAALPDWLPVPIVVSIIDGDHDGGADLGGLLELSELIAHRSDMPVQPIAGLTKIEAGSIYLAPSGMALRVQEGAIGETAIAGAPAAASLLRSAAASYRNRLLAVLLEGTLEASGPYAPKVVWAGGQVFAHRARELAQTHPLIRRGTARAYSAPDILAEAITLVCSRRPSLWAV